MSAVTTWNQGMCECTKGGCGLCLYTWCCPCFAFMEASDNIGENNGIIYCLMTFPLPFGCCMLGLLAEDVAKKRGVDSNMGVSCIKSCFNPCTCYSCTVVQESRVYKEQGAIGADPKTSTNKTTMERE